MLNIFFNKKTSNRLFLIITGITFLLLSSPYSFAQNIDTIKKIDSTKKVVIQKNSIARSPKKAAIYSAIVPGLGQAYNKKYWKIPIIYAGIGALAYSFNANNKKYVTYRNAYRDRVDNDPNTNDPYINQYSNDQLITLYKFYNRYRDLSAIGIGVIYALNIVDATVDAHLSTFNVSDDLTLNIRPSLMNTASLGKNYYKPCIYIKLNF